MRAVQGLPRRWPPPRLAPPCSYLKLAKINERYERAYVLQAIETASYQKRHKEMVDREREWMRDRPEWTVNQSHFYTQRQDRPSNDPMDPRTMERLNPM